MSSTSATPMRLSRFWDRRLTHYPDNGPRAQLLFLPSVLILTGRWSPKKARQDELDHERLVRAELALLEPREQGAIRAKRS